MTAQSTRDARAALRIVVAEDEAIIRLDLVETLAEEGYDVVGDVGRGDDAVAMVRSLDPDLVILDIKMPGLDGLSAARALSAERRCAVVVLTAFGQRELIGDAVDAGVSAYLVKPFQKSELVAAIEVAVARHREREELAGEVESLEARLEARTLIDRAKARLMTNGATEAEAFRLLQHRAMNERSTMRAIAEAVLAGELPVEED